MVDLFVVDDEKIICDGVASIPWENYGMRCVGQAFNGETALEKISEVKPDIVITDIRMPRADGIWLAEKLHNLMPHIKVIFLTGYHEFEYAQKAIRFDVCEYLLKPIKPDILIETVVKVKDAVLQEKEQSMRIETFRSQVRESKFFLKNWFFTETINVANEERLFQKLDFWGIDLGMGWYRTLIVQFSETDEMMENEFSFYKIFCDMEMLFSDTEKHCSFFEGATFTYIWNINEPETRKRKREFFRFCDSVKEYLDYNYTGVFIIGVGSETDSVRSLEQSRCKAEEACKYRFYVGDNQIVYLEDLEPAQRAERYSKADVDEYITALKVGSEEKLEMVLERMFAELQRRLEDIDIVKRICLELIVYTSNVIYEMGMNPELLFSNTDIWNVINRCSTIREIRELLLNINKVVISNCHSARTQETRKITTLVKEIIAEQYAQGVTLESVAEQVFLSPNYLSMLFSKETGSTFKDYLVNFRLKKAQELLKDPSMKIYQVAQEVGYGDWRYFSEVFKRNIGQSPAQYRASLEEQQSYFRENTE